jgi:nucleoid-associated protein YgaU
MIRPLTTSSGSGRLAGTNTGGAGTAGAGPLTAQLAARVAARPAGSENLEGGGKPRPILNASVMAFKARDGRSRRGFLHGRSRIVKLAVPAIPVIALLTVVAVGCSTKKGTTPTATSGALDVTPPPAQSAAMTYTPPAPYTPPPAQQVPAFTEPTPPAKTPPAQQTDAKGAARKTKAAAGATANATGKSGAKGGTAAAGTGGKSYTVQQRDTLFKIAKDQYGDGNQWKKIAAANPGLNADTLKVGQTITIPQ